MEIVVTGANGYLGQGIVKSLLDNGHQVIATDFYTNHIDARAKKVAGDLFEIKNPYDYFDQPSALLHLAWRNGFAHYSSSHIDDLPKHFAFVKNMAEAGIKKVSVMGSMHEIGFFEGDINENTPCHPITPYGIGKNALRNLTKMICEQNKVTFQWLRGYYIVGKSKSDSSIFAKITAAVEDGKTEFPFTLGQNKYDFIDYEDFCIRVTASVCQDEYTGIINICSGRPEKLADRVERFIRENGYNIKLRYGEFSDRPYDSRSIWGNPDKMEMILAANKCRAWTQGS